jgi:hypothetical protein
MASEEVAFIGGGFRKENDSILLTFMEGKDVNGFLKGFKRFKASNKLYEHMRLFIIPVLECA